MSLAHPEPVNDLDLLVPLVGGAQLGVDGILPRLRHAHGQEQHVRDALGLVHDRVELFAFRRAVVAEMNDEDATEQLLLP
jgi:hypothetical protein